MAINTITRLGEARVIGDLTARRFAGEFYDDGITLIGNAGTGRTGSPFCSQQYITKIELPNLTKIVNTSTSYYQTGQRGAFSDNPVLQSLILPNLTSIDSFSAFANNPMLETVYIPKIRSTVASMFYGCHSLKFDPDWIKNIVTIYSWAFHNATSLVDGNFENVTTVGAGNPGNRPGRAFYGCSGLRRLYLPLLTVFSGYQGNLDGTTALEIFRVPALTALPNQWYTGTSDAKGMKLLDLGVIPSIVSDVETKLMRYSRIVILRKTDAITTIANATVFNETSTPVPVKVYVPSSLKASYESGTNWSTLLANNYISFHNLEGSPYEQPDFDDTAIYNGDRNSL